jgi:hypothetical protein
MPTPTAGTKIIQVQLPNAQVELLDQLVNMTYVPRTKLVAMAIDRFVEDVKAGKVQMGMAALAQAGQQLGGSGPQPAFSVVSDPRGQTPPPPPTLPFDPNKQG